MAHTMKMNRLPQDDKTTGGSAILPDRTAHAQNVWSAVCQNALKVTKGTFGGVLAVDLATGRGTSGAFCQPARSLS